MLASFVFLAMLSQVLKGTWAAGTDIWEHAAAARQLGAHPFHPRHPQFLVDRAHVFYSPYHLVLGLIARFSGLSITTVFNLAGLGNILLLVFGLKLFADSLLGRKHAAFWALLFMLFLWRPDAWFFSGFLHWNVLALDFTYPSAFVTGLVFLTLAAHLEFVRRRDSRGLLALVGASFVVVLTHPMDAWFLGITAAAISFGLPEDPKWGLRATALTVGAVALGFLLALAWPYYSLGDMLFGVDNEGFRAAIAGLNFPMYSHALSRMFPLLITVPFAVRRWRRHHLDPLVLTLIALLFVYEYGNVSQDWSYGRVLSAVAIVAALILADARAALGEESRDPAMLGPPGEALVFWLRVSTIGLVLLGAFYVRSGFEVLPDVVVKRLPHNWVHRYVDNAKLSDFSFLERYLHEDDVVLSDIYTSLEVPVYGGKVVNVPRAEAFVPPSTRSADVLTFLDASSTDASRRTVINRYGAKFVLLSRKWLATNEQAGAKLRALGPVLYQNERFILIDLRRPASRYSP